MVREGKRSVMALVVAGGRGARLGGPVPKQYQSLAGIPVLRHALLAFCHHPAITAAAAVIGASDRELYDQAAQSLELLPPIVGGASRQQSVLHGLRGLAPLKPDLILIHDGARPFVSASVINNVLAGLDNHQGAIAAIPVVDSLKRGDDGVIIIKYLATVFGRHKRRKVSPFRRSWRRMRKPPAAIPMMLPWRKPQV